MHMKVRHLLLATATSVLLSVGVAHAADAFKIGEDPRFSWKSLDDFKAAHPGLEGQKLSIWDSWNNPGDAAQWNEVLSIFNQATGANAVGSSSKNYEEQARIDLEGKSPSDILILPQPGLLADFAKKGYLTDLGDDTLKWINDNYAAGSSWASYGNYEGPDGKKHQYGFPYKQELKSLVWYSPDNFAEKGYQVPKTMEELFDLSNKIIADGGTPWCIGLGSGGATGWVATDWIEDLMLRTQPPEVYDGWVDNTVKFNDPRVIQAMDIFGSIAKNDKMVAGGTKAVVTTEFVDSPKGLFTVPPQCYLHRQASFIASAFPDGTVAGQDYDFFYMPPYASHPELGRPVLGAGNIVTITKDSPIARAFIDFLKTPIANEIWMAQTNSAFLSALKSVNLDTYASDALRKQGQIMLDATTFRFDGSDLMPGAIGAGAFWTGMVDFVNGASAKDVADKIQAAWDKL
jgi:alpha-glucoside transport system substrate-binding protein